MKAVLRRVLNESPDDRVQVASDLSASETGLLDAYSEAVARCGSTGKPFGRKYRGLSAKRREPSCRRAPARASCSRLTASF